VLDGGVPRACLTAVVPCFNEASTIAPLLERVLRSPWVAEVVVVDDGSDDDTAELARKIASADSRVLVVEHDRNRGKAAALRTGFGHATADYVVVQDADLEYDPGEYHLLLEPLEAGVADVVYGSRFVSGRPHRVLFFWHSVGNRFLTLISNAFTDLNLTDMETCFKAFRRDVIQSIDIEEDRFGFEPEVTAKLAARGVRIYEVGISYVGRTYEDGKKVCWRDGVRALVCILKYSPVGRRVCDATAVGGLARAGRGRRR
jgi:glycosyltransferase involved in cell wall biosynthesis